MRAPFSRTLPDLLCEQALLHGDCAAVISDGRVTSYAELARRAAELASGLRARGVKRGDRVGLLASNRTEWIEICFGALAAGAVLVPISTWSTQAELEFILADADVEILFSVASVGKENFVANLSGLRPRLPNLRMLVMVNGAAPDKEWLCYESMFASAQVDLPPGDGPSATDDCLILYTSGSTSKPKAVRLAHYGLIENGFNIGERQGLVPSDRVFASVPMFWAYGAANALPATFTHGATLVLQERFEPGAALSLIETYQCTAIYTLPAMTSPLIGHDDFNSERTRSLRTGLTIGNPQDVINAASILGAAQICNIYGSSETYGNCCVTPHDWPLERRSASQGPPLPGVHIRLIDVDTGKPVMRGSPGLIEVSGYIMRGYGGQSAIHNAQIFTKDSWYRTGDIGTLTAEGEIVFLGRNSEMIKRAGINVSPAEVEDVLMQHADVAEAAVVGVPDSKRGETIIAFIVLATGASLSEDALIAHCRKIASSYKLPDRIEIRESLPSTTTGKLMRQSLKLEATKLLGAKETSDGA